MLAAVDGAEMETKMSEEPPELSPNLQRISQAIRGHGGPVQVLFCGFDLWLEVIGSSHMSSVDFLAGGKIAKGDEPENTLKVPMQALGGRIIVNFDPTIPPDQFHLKP